MIWKDIPGFNGYYQASDSGLIRSMPRIKIPRPGVSFMTKQKIIRPHVNLYSQVSFCVNGKRSYHLVHRLIAITFIENPEKLPEINHKNGIKVDNRVSNLEWSSRSQNQKHSYSLGLIKAKKGEDNIQHKLTDIQVAEIRSLYSKGEFSQRYIAGLYDVSQTRINFIVNMKARC